MLKFLHAADIHLDSLLRGLARYEDAPVERMRDAGRRALENLVELSIEEGVAFVIIAGDLFDGDWRDYATGLFFVRQMSRLRNANVLVFIARGNHDAQSKITRTLPLPSNVREFSSDRANSFELDALGVVLHGRSFAHRAEFADLAASFPARRKGLVNIGVLHTSLTGHDGHEPYAPCSVEELLAFGYDYWALGHIHDRAIVCERPYIVFPGNLQGRHMRETGAKGCTLVSVEHSRIIAVEHRALDTVRFVRATVDVTGARNVDQVAEQAREELERIVLDAGERLIAVRVELCGISTAHRMLVSQPDRINAAIHSAAAQLISNEIWIEQVIIGTTAREDATGNSGVIAEIADVVTDLTAHGASADFVRREIDALFKRLPPDVRKSAGIECDPDTAIALLRRAAELAQGRLQEREEQL